MESLEVLWGGAWLQGASEFRLTRHNYTDRNHTLACSSEFGDGYSAADWKYDIKSLSDRQVETLCDALRVNETFNAGNFFVTNGGRSFYGLRRAYFFERHGGNPPGNWLVHDIHGVITLGSWFGISGPVLCKKKVVESSDDTPRDGAQQSPAPPEADGVSWTRHPGKFLNLYAAGVSEVVALGAAQAACVEFGAACAGVTCGYDANFDTGEEGMGDVERSCTAREGRFPPGLQRSPTGEVSYVKHVKLGEEPLVFSSLPE